MSDVIKNLHTTIRRYCINKSSQLMEKYWEISSSGRDRVDYNYTDDALYTFPRYNVLNAILFEIERYVPEDFNSFDEAKRFFLLATDEAQSIFTKPPNGIIEQKAMAEEREALSKFIEQLTEDDLLLVEPLFYRRVLSSEESTSIWEKLRSRWEITEHYWYPLSLNKPDNVEAFQDAYFDKEVGAEKLQAILHSRGIKTVWEMREDTNDYELELSAFEPNYNLAEGYWCDNNFDWIIRAFL